MNNPLRFKFIAHGPPSVETRREVYSHARQHIERTKRARRMNIPQKTPVTIPKSPPASPKLPHDKKQSRRRPETDPNPGVTDKSPTPPRHRTNVQTVVTPPTPTGTPMPTWSMSTAPPTAPATPTDFPSDLTHDDFLDYNFDWTSLTDYYTDKMLLAEQHQSLSYPSSYDLHPQSQPNQTIASNTTAYHTGSNTSVIPNGIDVVPVPYYSQDLEAWLDEHHASSMSDMAVASGYFVGQNEVAPPVTWSGWD